jgi:tetratricopeptide (TPR) repeat protein
VTGRPPAPGAAEGGALPAALEPIAARALAADPEERFQTAGELLLALEELRLPAAARGASVLPYRYLEAFLEEDARWFFGREAETTALQLLLARRPVVAVVGPAGAGKSSLVRAGLVPRLRLDDRPWRVLALHPGAAPLEALCARLPAGEGGLDAAALRERPGLAGDRLRALAATTGERVLLLVDQLEELYTLGAPAGDRAAFAAALAAGGDDPAGDVRVALTVREDFLPRLAESPELEEQVAQHRVRVRPPHLAAMVEALRRPAHALGYRFEDGMEEEVAAALANEPTPLPLLELTASRLWERRDEARRLVPRAALRELGGVAGIMATHAEEVLDELGTPSAVGHARALLTELVTAERTKQRRDRDRLLASTADPAAAARVLDHLVARRLLISRGAGIELPSEALLERWDRLRGWLDEGVARRVARERLEQAAGHWDERRRPAELLWRGRLLADGEELASAPLSPVAAAFLESSLARRRRSRRARLAALAAVGLALVAIAVGASAAMRVHAVERDHAREFARLLLFDLREGIEGLPGATPVMNQLVSASLVYYRATVDPDAGDHEQRRRLATGYERLGELAARLGRSEDARELVDRALRIQERLARERGADPDPDGDVARAHARLGRIALDRTRLDEAERHYLRALELRRGRAAARPDDPGAEADLADAHQLLGQVEKERGRFAEARRHLHRALEVRERLATRAPERLDWLGELAVTHQMLGNVFLAELRFEPAQLHYERARLVRLQRVEASPGHTSWLSDLARSHAVLAELAKRRGRHEESLAQALTMLGITTRLAMGDPTNVDLRRQQAFAHARVGVASRELGRLAEARLHWELEQAVIGRVAAGDPGNVGHQRELARSSSRLGEIAEVMGDLDAAETHQRRSLAIRERILAGDPAAAIARRELTYSLERLAIVADRRGRADEALALDLRALGIREALARAQPDKPEIARELLMTHDALGERARRGGDLPRAIFHEELCAALAAARLGVEPRDDQARADLAGARRKLALIGGAAGAP